MPIKKAGKGEKVPKPASDEMKRKKDLSRLAESLAKRLAQQDKRAQSDESRRKGS